MNDDAQSAPEANVTATAQEPLNEAANTTQVEGTSASPQEGEGQLNAPLVEAKPKQTGAEKRIAELLYERKAVQERERVAQEQNRQLLELLNAQKQTQQPQVQPSNEDPKPNLANYQDYDEYMAAHAAWTARAEYKRIRAEETKAEQARQFAAQQQQQKQSQEKYVSEIATSWEANRLRGEGRFPDFEEKVYGIPAEHMPATIAEAIATSPVGDEVAYYLGTHREVLKQISTMTPINQIREIAKLEMRAGKAAQSNAPAPINPVQGSNPTSSRPSSKDSKEDWFRKRKAEFMKNRGA